MGIIDLTEACIKALEKISGENPHVVLTSGALNLSLGMMDFFENSTQKRILSLCLNSVKHIANEADFDKFVEPVIPLLCTLVD